MSTLLSRIEAELRTCTDPVRRVDLIAERACYLARSGGVDEANEIAKELRSGPGHRDEPRTMLWVMIIEALVLFFGKLSASAEDRMNRAYALSSSLAIRDLSDISSARLAHFKFERSDYAEMTALLGLVLQRQRAAPKAAVLRAAIVAADAFQIAGIESGAREWYELARSIALSIGDRAAIGAIMYNRSALGLAYLDSHSIAAQSNVDGDRLRLFQVEIESARSFQDGTQIIALAHLTELSRAQALHLAGQWSEAARVLEAVLAELETIDDRPKRPDVRADLAWCWLNAGRRDEAAALLSQISMQSAQSMDIDDQVTYLSRLIRLREALGTDLPSADELAAFRAVCDDYLKHVETLRAELQKLPSAQDFLQSRG